MSTGAAFLRLCPGVSLQLPLVIYVRAATSGRQQSTTVRSRQMTYRLIISSAKCPIARRNSDGWPGGLGPFVPAVI